MCEVINIGDKFLTKYNEEIVFLGRGNNDRRHCDVQFIGQNKIMTVMKKSVYNGCSLKNENTRTFKGIGYLGFLSKKDFPYTVKEMKMWEVLISRYDRNKCVECEELCEFKTFLIRLRELEDYDKLMKDRNARLFVDREGNMKVEYVSFLKPCRRVHMRTGKVIEYNSLRECADALGLSETTIKKEYIMTGNIYRGYRIEFIES